MSESLGQGNSLCRTPQCPLLAPHPLTSQTLHLAASYGFLKDGWHFIDRGSINFSVDLLTVDYHEFTDLRTDAAIGEEPLYALDADIVQLFFSFWY